MSRGDEALFVDADRMRLCQVMSNLLTNAIKYSPDAARITRGRITLKRETLNLATVLDTALEAARPLAEARDQKLVVNRGEEDLFVEADEVRLCQVVTNLLTNAIKYSPDSGRIDVWLQSTPQLATLCVLDEGVGIDPQMLPRVFDMYQQGDHSLDRPQGGLGVGLTVVKHLVEMHGGTVRVENRPEGGACFTLTLPRG